MSQKLSFCLTPPRESRMSAHWTLPCKTRQGIPVSLDWTYGQGGVPNRTKIFCLVFDTMLLSAYVERVCLSRSQNFFFLFLLLLKLPNKYKNNNNFKRKKKKTPQYMKRINKKYKYLIVFKTFNYKSFSFINSFIIYEIRHSTRSLYSIMFQNSGGVTQA